MVQGEMVRKLKAVEAKAAKSAKELEGEGDDWSHVIYDYCSIPSIPLLILLAAFEFIRSVQWRNIPAHEERGWEYGGPAPRRVSHWRQLDVLRWRGAYMVLVSGRTRAVHCTFLKPHVYMWCAAVLLYSCAAQVSSMRNITRLASEQIQDLIRANEQICKHIQDNNSAMMDRVDVIATTIGTTKVHRHFNIFDYCLMLTSTCVASTLNAFLHLSLKICTFCVTPTKTRYDVLLAMIGITCTVLLAGRARVMTCAACSTTCCACVGNCGTLRRSSRHLFPDRACDECGQVCTSSRQPHHWANRPR